MLKSPASSTGLRLRLRVSANGLTRALPASVRFWASGRGPPRSGDQYATLGIALSIDSGAHRHERSPRRRRGPGTSLLLGGMPVNVPTAGRIPLVRQLIGMHADLRKHARIGVQSLQLDFVPLSPCCTRSIRVPVEDSHRTARRRGCVIHPEDHNGPTTHWSPACSPSRS